ncbi:MAG: hypothetical protein QNJ18_08335 [Xenococcaceae cyanobacterium MO_167.B52]|nr:hypothetical protein [Xenococcaceae cyanobacterium MO_167.B52]
MKNNQFLHISCLGLMALLHGVSLNQSTIAKANNQNASSLPLLSSILSNVQKTHSNFEITPVVDDFTHHLADELTNHNLEVNQQYFTQPSLKSKSDFDQRSEQAPSFDGGVISDFVFYDN